MFCYTISKSINCPSKKFNIINIFRYFLAVLDTRFNASIFSVMDKTSTSLYFMARERI